MNIFHNSVEVSEKSAIYYESVGKRKKFWFEHENQRLMFKRNETPGEDWSEVLACRIAGLLDIPHASYEFAHLVDAAENRSEKGVITESFVGSDQNLTLGNTLLLDHDPEYDAVEGNYKIIGHTIDAISGILTELHPPLGVVSPGAIKHYASYLFLDVLIANQDRHHENWGVIEHHGINYLAPTYDHASSFAWNVSDDKKLTRLSTSNPRYGVRPFAEKAKSAINENEGGVSTRLTTRKALENFCLYNNITVDRWQSRLMNISELQLSDTIATIPEHYMTEIARDFTLSLLKVNRNYLLGLS